jgi:hypothetical protein
MRASHWVSDWAIIQPAVGTVRAKILREMKSELRRDEEAVEEREGRLIMT